MTRALVTNEITASGHHDIAKRGNVLPRTAGQSVRRDGSQLPATPLALRFAGGVDIMPQPLTHRQSEGIRWAISSLQERPACAAGVANVASTWAFLEFSLIMMFFQATGEAQLHEDGEVELRGHPLAVSPIASLESTTAKLDVISAGIAAYLPSMSAAFEKLKSGVRSCAKERNRIVHAIWGISDRYPDAIIRVETFDSKFIKYTPQDFETVADRIKKQVEAVTAFDTHCRRERLAELTPKQGGAA